MAILRIKPGVIHDSVHPATWFAVGVAYCVFGKYGISARITSMRDDDPQRVSNSLHNSGMAVDFGARRLSPEEEQTILKDLVDQLDHLGFDVILHGEGASRHYHIEYDLKPGEVWLTVAN